MVLEAKTYTFERNLTQFLTSFWRLCINNKWGYVLLFVFPLRVARIMNILLVPRLRT